MSSPAPAPQLRVEPTPRHVSAAQPAATTDGHMQRQQRRTFSIGSGRRDDGRRAPTPTQRVSLVDGGGGSGTTAPAGAAYFTRRASSDATRSLNASAEGGEDDDAVRPLRYTHGPSVSVYPTSVHHRVRGGCAGSDGDGGDGDGPPQLVATQRPSRRSSSPPHGAPKAAMPPRPSSASSSAGAAGPAKGGGILLHRARTPTPTPTPRSRSRSPRQAATEVRGGASGPGPQQRAGGGGGVPTSASVSTRSASASTAPPPPPAQQQQQQQQQHGGSAGAGGGGGGGAHGRRPFAASHECCRHNRDDIVAAVLLRSQVAALRSHLEAAERQLVAQERAVLDGREEVDALTARNAALEEELHALRRVQAELDVERGFNDKLMAKVEEKEQRAAAAEGECAALRQRVEAVSADNAAHCQALREAEEGLRKAKDEAAALRDSEQLWRGKVAELQSAQRGAAATQLHASGELDALREQVEDHRAVRSEMLAALAEKEKKVALLEQQLAAFSARGFAAAAASSPSLAIAAGRSPAVRSSPGAS